MTCILWQSDGRGRSPNRITRGARSKIWAMVGEAVKLARDLYQGGGEEEGAETGMVMEEGYGFRTGFNFRFVCHFVTYICLYDIIMIWYHTYLLELINIVLVNVDC